MSDFKPLYVLKMLHVVRHHLSVDELLNLGLEYYQIARLISELLQKEYVVDSDEGLSLTEMGLWKLEELNRQLNPGNTQNWILPSDENRISKIDKFDIYLPRKKAREE